MEKTLAYPKHS